MIAAFIAALLVALGLAPAPTTIAAPAVGLEHAVRLTVEPPIVLEAGAITDTTGYVLPLLQSLYTPTELASGGPVIIRRGDTGIYLAWVLWDGLCREASVCVEVGPTPVDRAVLAHEWGHVLTERYRKQMTGGQHRRFDEGFRLANQECVADSLAAIILKRGGLPPSTGRYQCGPFWTEQGLDPVEMEQLSITLAQTVLAWAD